MAVLPILRFPDQRLHTVAKPVDAFDDSLRRLVSDMAETMYAAPGIGLAATQVCEEGCLSVPGFYENVERPDRVTVRARDEHGQEFTIEAEGLLAVCIQHEMDHLKGRVFVQYLSRLKQYRIRAKLLKQDREAA